MARRRYQEGSLMLRGKNPVWVGRWREDVRQPDGTIARVNKKEVLGSIKDFPTKRLALRELNSRIAHVNSLEYRPTSIATLAHVLPRWVETVLPNHKPSTQCSVRAHISGSILPKLGDIPLRQLTGEVLQRFASSLDVAPKTVRNIVSSLRMIWKSLRAWGYVNHTPFEGLILPKAVRPKRIAFSLAQVKAILAKANEPYKTIFWLLAETGLRGGELCGLYKSDFDPDRGVLSVRRSAWRGQLGTPKSENGTRTFALSPELTERLRSHIESDGGVTSSVPLLFHTCNGNPLDADNVRHYGLHPVLEALGIERAGLHAFRHTNATVMDELDVPLATRTSRLGHSDPSITIGVYSHRIAEADRAFAAQLGKELNVVSEEEEALVA